VLTALSELHIAVPDEISVVGNDDIPFHDTTLCN